MDLQGPSRGHADGWPHCRNGPGGGGRFPGRQHAVEQGQPSVHPTVRRGVADRRSDEGTAYRRGGGYQEAIIRYVIVMRMIPATRYTPR